MTKFQSIATIVIALSIFLFVLAGQAKISAFIISFALLTSMITVMYSVLFSKRKENSLIQRIDWN